MRVLFLVGVFESKCSTPTVTIFVFLFVNSTRTAHFHKQQARIIYRFFVDLFRTSCLRTKAPVLSTFTCIKNPFDNRRLPLFSALWDCFLNFLPAKGPASVIILFQGSSSFCYSKGVPLDFFGFSRFFSNFFGRQRPTFQISYCFTVPR